MIVLSVATVAITFGAMLLLLLSVISSPAALILAAPSPTVEPIVQAERDAPISDGAMALPISRISGLLAVILSFALLCAQRASRKP
jgi:hypothetical protein